MTSNVFCRVFPFGSVSLELERQQPWNLGHACMLKSKAQSYYHNWVSTYLLRFTYNKMLTSFCIYLCFSRTINAWTMHFGHAYIWQCKLQLHSKYWVLTYFAWFIDFVKFSCLALFLKDYNVFIMELVSGIMLAEKALKPSSILSLDLHFTGYRLRWFWKYFVWSYFPETIRATDIKFGHKFCIFCQV